MVGMYTVTVPSFSIICPPSFVLFLVGVVARPAPKRGFYGLFGGDIRFARAEEAEPMRGSIFIAVELPRQTVRYPMRLTVILVITSPPLHSALVQQLAETFSRGHDCLPSISSSSSCNMAAASWLSTTHQMLGSG